jgi:hypothetical protein
MGIRSDHILGAQSISSRTAKLSISIGGISCAIISHDNGFLNLLRERYQWFESPVHGGYEILVQPVPVKEFAQEDVGLLYPIAKKVNSRNNHIIRQADNPFVAIINTASKRVVAKMGNSQYCFDSFLRTLLALILADEGGLFLQATAVSDSGRGRVFFGPSGSGKTTIARLSEDRTILSDELVLIRPHSSGYRVYGTPSWGEFAPCQNNGRAELDGLYSLKKDHENSLVPMDRVQAVAEICRCVPSFSNDDHLASRIHDICRTLVNTVPVYKLHFRPDPSFWQVVKSNG